MYTFRKVCVAIASWVCISASLLSANAEERAETIAGVETAEKKALTPADEEALRKMLQAPAGVIDPEYGADGVLLRLKIKGAAPVAVGLRGPRAEGLAREKAERDAKAAFVKFLREEVSVRENEKEETIIVEKDGQEQAGYKMVATREFESRANGLLRGMIVLVDRFDDEGGDRTATVVFGWSKKLADAARTAQAEMARTTNPAETQKAAAQVGDSVSTGTKTRTAENLTDF